MFSWINFFTYVFTMGITPGPNNIMSMSNASSLGFKKAVPFNFGVWAGASTVATLCAMFCSMLSSVIPKIKLPMLIAGGAYMLYLAWKTFNKSAGIGENDAKGGFISGLSLQFVNPKIYICYIVALEGYILPFYHGEPLILFCFAILMAAIGFLCTLCWSAFGSAFKVLFSKYAKATNTVMALLLVYCAISLFL